MYSEIRKVLKLKNFFNIISVDSNTIKYSLKKPSRLIMLNIYAQWLHSIYQKTVNYFPVIIDNSYDELVQERKLPIAYINKELHRQKDNIVLEHNNSEFLPNPLSTIKFNIIMSKSDILQWFLQWQRHRKFWWSSIASSPGLFSLSDIKYGDITEVDILAHLPWGKQTVEKISFYDFNENVTNTDISKLESSMTLEGALLTMLLDAVKNNTSENYLRLNKKLAPYNLAFSLEYEESKNKEMLQDLATLLNYKINSNNIPTWIPDFSLPFQEQLLLCREMGVAYVAVLNDNTLSNGIFNLMNSSTMLNEKIHIADFESYAKMLCR